MGIGIKTIAAGVGLFILGGVSVYWLTSNSQSAAAAAPHQSAAMQEAIEQMRSSAADELHQNDQGQPAEVSQPEVTQELTHEAFLAEAAARREERLINKEEADRLAKLKARKEHSVECKFWRQQQKTSSAAAKIEEKINEYCNLPGTASSDSSSSEASEEDTMASDSV
jgi:hypothetical protein